MSQPACHHSALAAALFGGPVSFKEPQIRQAIWGAWLEIPSCLKKNFLPWCTLTIIFLFKWVQVPINSYCSFSLKCVFLGGGGRLCLVNAELVQLFTSLNRKKKASKICQESHQALPLLAPGTQGHCCDMLTATFFKTKSISSVLGLPLCRVWTPAATGKPVLLDTKLLRNQSVQLVRKQTKIRTPCINKIMPLRINLGKFPSTKQRE